MQEYWTARELANDNDRKRKLSFLKSQGEEYLQTEIDKISADKRYKTEQQKETAIGLLRDGYAIDADEARAVFESLPNDPTNDQYSRG